MTKVRKARAPKPEPINQIDDEAIPGETFAEYCDRMQSDEAASEANTRRTAKEWAQAEDTDIWMGQN